MSKKFSRYCKCLSVNLTFSCQPCTFFEKASLSAVCRKIWECRYSAVLECAAEKSFCREACVFTLLLGAFNYEIVLTLGIPIGEASLSALSIACMMLVGSAA